MYRPFLEYTGLIESDAITELGFEPTVDGWAQARGELEDAGFRLSEPAAEQVALLAEPYIGPDKHLMISPTAVTTASPTLETVIRQAGFDPKKWRHGTHYKHDTHGNAKPKLATDDDAGLTFMVVYSKEPLPFPVEE